MKQNNLTTGIVACHCRECRQSVEKLVNIYKNHEPHVSLDILNEQGKLRDFILFNKIRYLVVISKSDKMHREAVRLICRGTGIITLATEFIDTRLIYSDENKEVAELTLVLTIAKMKYSLLTYDAIQKRITKTSMVSRREFLQTFIHGVSEHSEVPLFFQEKCKPYIGYCSHCISACMFNIISKDKNVIKIDSELCVECGACAAACPVGAIQIPTFDDSQVFKLIHELTESGNKSTKIIILMTCDQGMDLLSSLVDAEKFLNPGYIILRTPCIAAVSWAHLLAMIANGLNLVLLCPNKSCERVGGLTYVRDACENVNSILRGLRIQGLVAELVEHKQEVDLPSLLHTVYAKAWYSVKPSRDLSGDRREAVKTAVGMLLTEAEKSDSIIDGGNSALLFDVSVNEKSCTLCNACESVCPENAVKLQKEDREVALWFNPSRCVGCLACQEMCPENAIFIQRRLIQQHVTGGWVEKVKKETVSCKLCGQPIFPSALINKVSSMLYASGFCGEMEWLYICQDCKARRNRVL